MAGRFGSLSRTPGLFFSRSHLAKQRKQNPSEKISESDLETRLNRDEWATFECVRSAKRCSPLESSNDIG